MTVITLTTDFGLADPYVAMMKGVILGIAPTVTIVDISHQIPAQGVREGSLILAEGIGYFPSGTIHVAVVDPGVGSARRAIVAQFDGFTFVGPDNGLITPLLEKGRATVREIVHPDLPLKEVSTTFHGRDLFAPAAARLAIGFPFEQVGPTIDAPVRLTDAPVTITPGKIEGRVTRIDRFGNALTNIDRDTVATKRHPTVSYGDTTFPLVGTYADRAVGEQGALIGSDGKLELFVREGDAASRHNLTVDAVVTLIQ